MTMTDDAKKKLAAKIRDLRGDLLSMLHDAVQSEYRFDIKQAQHADLDEARRARRRRFEEWLAEQERAERSNGTKTPRTRDDFRRDAEKQAAYTLLNRLVFLRLLEAAGLRAPAVVAGGWESRAYRDFRELAPALVRDDPTEGFGFLLRLVFEDLAHDLPGLYGPAGVADLVPITPAVLRLVVEALDDDGLASCWDDDMTFGWVYQYWNDPEREALDAKLNSGGKIEPHEIAAKTQMFTERYIVDWLLQNSLGPMWLAMCKKHGWTPEAEADGTLARLEERRVAWRAKRDAGEVELTELMPLHTEMERRWAYYVPQPIPDDAIEHAPETVREIKLLDPAVGSGHFLVVAFDLLFALYKEEGRHRGEADGSRWSDRTIVERILERNLHGIDLDPRAVQIAAASLWLKAQRKCGEAQPASMNLVASNLRLASLPDDDPALLELREEVERETGIPARLTDQIVHALTGADHLGSLLKVDGAVEDAIRAHEREIAPSSQTDLFGTRKTPPNGVNAAETKSGVLRRLERFLERCSSEDELGLRLRGEQLARGIRFVRLMREGAYDLVVGNPPYQGTSKMTSAKYIEKHYEFGKADLYAAFLLRGLELARAGGVSCLLTMRNWMFIKQYASLRRRVLTDFDLRAVGDFAIGAFDEVPNDLLSVAAPIVRRLAPVQTKSTALQPTSPVDRAYDRQRTRRKRAATLCQVGRHEFTAAGLRVVPEWPLVYWWDASLLSRYSGGSLLGHVAPAVAFQSTSDNTRFLRRPWEIVLDVQVVRGVIPAGGRGSEPWQPCVNGADGAEWIEPVRLAIAWRCRGLELRVKKEFLGQGNGSLANEHRFFTPGVALTMIGDRFAVRAHRVPSIMADQGNSLFPRDIGSTVCALNSSLARFILGSLNPSMHFQAGDVNRLAISPDSRSSEVFKTLVHAFDGHEAARETSPEFRAPGPSAWRAAQEWAQRAVDTPVDQELPTYHAEFDDESPDHQLSYAIGVALGRFSDNGSGVVSPPRSAGQAVLPAGVLFIDGTLPEQDDRDSLGDPAAAPLSDTWTRHRGAYEPRTALRDWLTCDFFKVHRGMYENRPIHWPLSSEKKTFVAWINIHRWNQQTLRSLSSEHLHTARARLAGELTDLRKVRDCDDKKAAGIAEKRYEKVLKWQAELEDFIAKVTQCAEKGPPPTEPKCPTREVDSRYVPDLDDGVMINSAALWPLLEPQWKDAKKWWKELATGTGKHDYDWSHLAMRYWPTRVDAKCKDDPSLGVAHGCFWRYHPARAWAWELRLQDEIAPDFRIEEKPYDPPGLESGPTGDQGDAVHRAAYLRDRASEALASVEKEALRRRGRGKDATPISSMTLLERGLWSALPEDCWELELRVSEKQGAEFRLLAPDESEARAAFEAANPTKVTARRQRLASLARPMELDLEPEDSDESSDELDAEDEATV